MLEKKHFWKAWHSEDPEMIQFDSALQITDLDSISVKPTMQN